MVATVIAFPNLVTGNVTAAATVKGTGEEELRRQLEGAEPSAPEKASPGERKPDDAASEIERALKQEK
jgi:hypothetical protein